MPRILQVFFRPPLAIARLGGSATPLENFIWRNDPTIHGAAQNTIEPALSLRVAEDGRLVPYMPTILQFRDGEHLRPVAPFLELWANAVFSESELKDDASHQLGTTPATVAGQPEIVPLTSRLLEKAGGDLGGVLYTIHLGNRKAARRTSDMANAFEAWLQVRADDFRSYQLLAITPPAPAQEPLVFPDRPIPLGSFQAIRPLPHLHSGANLDVLRVRYTPARGEVYGPPAAIQGQDSATGRFFEIVPPENRFLNPKASWAQYDGSYQKFLNPEPFDTYDGADQPPNISWGVVDDTCDGIVKADVVAQGQRFTALARLSTGPAHFAPDRRPFLSLADDLADRDLEPATQAELLQDEPDTQDRIADLFQRAFETASLVSLDGTRSRALGDNSSAGLRKPKMGDLPFTDARSMTSKDKPFADAKVDNLIGPTAPPLTSAVPQPFSALVPLAHAQLAQQDELLDFLLNQALRLQKIIRPPYGRFVDMQPKIANTAQPNDEFRDPRVDRDQAHDMRMPPYMRDELGAALGLTRRQYVELLSYVDHLAHGRSSIPKEVAERVLTAVMASSSALPNMPLRRRICATLERLRQYRQPPTPEAAEFVPLPEQPWLHLLPGVRPLAFLVRGSQVFEVDEETYKRLEADDEIAHQQLRAMIPAQHQLDLDNVCPPAAPTAVSLNIAQACNLECTYCYADEGRFQGSARMMPVSVAVHALNNLFDSAKPGSRVTVGFIGGEPFLNRDVLYRSVDYSQKLAAERQVAVGFSVTTNGTMLTSADLHLLRDNAFAVSVSLDGDEKTHDRHRHGHNGTATWRAIIERLGPLLQDPGSAKLAARATLTRDDLCVSERVAALTEVGFPEVGVSPARTGPAPALLLRGGDWEVYLRELILAADEDMKRIRASGGAAGWRFSNLGIALKEIYRGTCRPLPCGAGYGYVSVNAEGDYFTCHRTLDDRSFELGGPAGPEFSKRRRFLEQRHVDRQIPCRSCWARYLCGGGCHAEVISSDRDGCDMIRGWLEHCLRLYNVAVDEFPQLLASHKEPCQL